MGYNSIISGIFGYTKYRITYRSIAAMTEIFLFNEYITCTRRHISLHLKTLIIQYFSSCVAFSVSLFCHHDYLCFLNYITWCNTLSLNTAFYCVLKTTVFVFIFFLSFSRSWVMPGAK